MTKFKKLGEIATVGSSKRIFMDDYTAFGVPFFRSKEIGELGKGQDIQTELFISQKYYDEIKNKFGVPKVGDILLTSVGSIGNTWIVDNRNFYFKDGNITHISPKEVLHNKYLQYYFDSTFFLQSLTKDTSGTAYNALTIAKIKNLQIPLLPLSEQKRIAQILDTADRQRQKTKALLEKYEELAQSIFLEMFGDPVKNERGWKVKKLSEVCTKITDGTHHSPEPQVSGFPYVTAKHVKPFKLDFESKPSFIDEDAHNEIYKRCNPKYGDILYIKDGATTGVACINIFKEPISLLSSLALLKLGDELNNQFLCHWLNHEGIKQKLISEFMSGAAIKRYTLKKINNFKVLVPNIDLQNTFAQKIENIEVQKQKLQKSLQASEDLFQALLQETFR